MDERKLDMLTLSETKLKGRRDFRWEKVRDIKGGVRDTVGERGSCNSCEWKDVELSGRV